MTIANLIPALVRNNPGGTGWISGGADVVTTAYANGPDGNPTAWLGENHEGGFASYRAYGVTVAADTATYSACFFVKKTLGTSYNPGLGVTFGDPASPSTYYGVSVDTTAGTISTIGGWAAPAASGIVSWDDDYWMVYVEAPNNSQTTAAIRIFHSLNTVGVHSNVFWTPILAAGSVHPLVPVADFSYTPSYGGAPLPVDFTDLSTGALTWAWDFGDGTTSTSQNPSTTYTDAGVRRTVSLSITTEFSGTKTKTVQNAIGITAAPSTFPCLAWDNLLTAAGVTLVASSEQSGFPKENAADWRPFTWWKPDDGVATYELDFGSAQEFNAFAVYGHTLGASGGWIKLQYSLDAGATWLDAAPAVSPAGTEVIYQRCIPTVASRIRFQISSTPASPFACLWVGTDMQLERGCYMGFGPPRYNRSTQLTNTVSVNGVWLGRSILQQGAMVSLDLDHLTEDFIREEWEPFVEHAELYPWFLLWDQSAHADEAAWCFADGAIPGSQFTSVGLMKASIKAMARVQ